MFLKLSIFGNYNPLPAQMCKLCIALIEIAQRRTYLQWLWYYHYTVLAAVISWQNFFFDFNHFFDINALLIWVFMRHKSHGKCYVSNIFKAFFEIMCKKIFSTLKFWHDFLTFSISSLLGKIKLYLHLGYSKFGIMKIWK